MKTVTSIIALLFTIFTIFSETANMAMSFQNYTTEQVTNMIFILAVGICLAVILAYVQNNTPNYSYEGETCIDLKVLPGLLSIGNYMVAITTAIMIIGNTFGR